MLESFCQSNMLQKNRTIGTVCLKSYNAFGFCVDKYWPSEVMMIKLALRGDDDDQVGPQR